jgi:hypothetical protein
MSKRRPATPGSDTAQRGPSRRELLRAGTQLAAVTALSLGVAQARRGAERAPREAARPLWIGHF